jgi:hypothetical protein
LHGVQNFTGLDFTMGWHSITGEEDIIISVVYFFISLQLHGVDLEAVFVLLSQPEGHTYDMGAMTALPFVNVVVRTSMHCHLAGTVACLAGRV